MSHAEERSDRNKRPVKDPPPVGESVASAVPEQVAALLSCLIARPDRAGRYEDLVEIGRGGMATVYQARDRELGRAVALKVAAGTSDLPAGHEEELDRTQRFLAEAQITGQLDHPGIVSVHEMAIDAAGRLFFSMKLVRGHNLATVFDLVQDGRDGWNEVRALAVLLKVCEAVAFAHERRVVHRDLKPANIMVGRFGEVFVMDWGLARVLGRPDAHGLRPRPYPSTTLTTLETVRTREPSGHESPLITMDGRIVGTPCYMAPEQAQGHVDQVNERSDVYSLGAILYQLLTGMSPYAIPHQAMTPHTVLARVLEGPPRPIAELNPAAPAALVAICEKAMARRSDDRYPSALELAQDVQAYLEHRPVRARPPSLRQAISLWVQRNRAIALSGTVALATVLSALIWFMLHQERVRRNTERTSDVMAVRALLSEEEQVLTPLLPEGREQCGRWLDRVRSLLDRVPAYRAEVRQQTDPEPPLGREEMEAMLAAVGELEAARDRVERSLADASGHRQRAVGAQQVPWSEVLADLARTPVFRDLHLQEQPGLVPLGKNQAGLWQFWHVPSGHSPGSTDGTIAPGAATGMVLVLLPGGDITIGWDGGESNERLQHLRRPPFLLAMHETTQGQWLHAMGNNPSRRKTGTRHHDILYSATHPVESVTWFEAQRLASRLGLRLPEAPELEYAGRANVPGSHLFAGRHAEQQKGLENLREQSFAARFGGSDALPWDDGFPENAPVGSFRMNPFGLYDVGGNVSEWTATLYGPEAAPGEADPSGTPITERLRCVRGGSWGSRIKDVRASYNMFYRPGYSSHWVGVRLARDWTKP